MRIIDPFKLGQHRNLVDEEVVAYSLDQGLNRPQAYLQIAKDLGGALLMSQGRSQWWSVVCLSQKFLETSADSSTGFPSEYPVGQLAKAILDLTIFGPNPEDVASAAILRMIDPSLDLFLEPSDMGCVYPSGEWSRIAQAAPFAGSKLPATDQMLLGEDDSAYEQRKHVTDFVNEIQKQAFDLLMPTQLKRI